MNDATSPAPAAAANAAERKWRPLDRFQRRVLGTLAEKAKTTPDVYPMTVAGITTGCNQKSNRSPQMNLTNDQVEGILEQLRAMGAVTEVFGTGRVSKYRHHLYEWLDVKGAEAAVMIELLLRGEQTVGELRGRAARFDESISDLGALKPVLEALLKKELILALTPEGRGQIVSHNLYRDQELDAIRREIASGAYTSTSSASEDTSPAASGSSSASLSRGELEQRLEALTARVAKLEAHLGLNP